VLEGKLGPEWAEWAESAGRFRAAVRQAGLTSHEQEACFDRFVSGTLDAARLAVRIPTSTEVQHWLGVASSMSPLALAPEAGKPPATAPGLVSLVGAGPGCPGLLTLRGRERTLAADAVVYDRLAAGALPTDLPAHIELHGVGKEAGHHPVPQEQINELLVSLAKAGKRVVRFKGGDPYVFGRGSEEAEALSAAGLRFEVVPGVTSGIAVPAWAGIPVTHRREAVQVTLLTAHECVKSGGPQVRWDLLAREPHGTLVGYMGMSALGFAVDRLLGAGMAPETPAAVIQQGTTAAERSVVATLATLVETARAAGMQPPALFIIGPTVRHADILKSSVWRPLAGERLAIGAGDTTLRAALEEAGAEVVSVPMPITPAARIVLAARPLTGCVVRSAAEVESFDEECRALEGAGGWTGWCIGRPAAARAGERGWRYVELTEVEAARVVDCIAAHRAAVVR
jgi:uroporphyrin-III C-methyltransferase